MAFRSIKISKFSRGKCPQIPLAACPFGARVMDSLLKRTWSALPLIHIFRACLHEGGGPQVGEVTCGGLPHLTCKRDHIKTRHYMDRRVTLPKRVTSPSWGPPPSCKQTLKICIKGSALKVRPSRLALSVNSFLGTSFTSELRLPRSTQDIWFIQNLPV